MGQGHSVVQGSSSAGKLGGEQISCWASGRYGSLREGGVGSWPSQISQVRGLQGMHPQNKCTHKRGPTGGSLSADSFAPRRSSQEKGDDVPVRSNLCSSGKPVPLLPHTLPLAGRGLRGMTGGKRRGGNEKNQPGAPSYRSCLC